MRMMNEYEGKPRVRPSESVDTCSCDYIVNTIQNVYSRPNDNKNTAQ